MARRAAAAVVVLLLACTVLQAAATPSRTDLLRFLRPDAPSLQQQAQQEHNAGRRLQQDAEFVDQGGPFTFDGFGFGFGGINPAGGAFGGFANNVYNILFKDLLNSGLNEYVSRALTNNGGVNPLDLLDPTIGAPWRRDVVSLFGYDYFDKYLGQYLTRAKASTGGLVDAGCVAPVYSVQVNGGSCEIMDDGSVECSQPNIVLKSTPLTCNLPYREGASLSGGGWQYKVSFGSARKGEVGLPAAQYNFGAATNITTPYLGLNLQTRRLANDFGVQQWYQFLGNLVLNDLLRIQAALVSGAVDSRILTQQAQERADAAAAGGGNARTVAEGLQDVQDATSKLFGKVAARMNITADQLTAGLRAAGVLPQSVAQQRRQQQVKPAQQQTPPGDGSASGTQADQLAVDSSSGERTGTLTRSVAVDTETTSDSLLKELDSNVAQVEAATQQPGQDSMSTSAAGN